ncbi:MAG TPA: hypothetical protein VF627_10940 [Abditibacterium sp.]|jgi:hypothetical protein
MKTHLLAATLLLSLPAFAQDEKPLSPTKIPLRADAPVLFAPRGWKIEKTVRGDLNRDKIADAALVLVEQKPAKDNSDNPAPRQRALVVLLKEGKGFRRAGFNNSLLLGTRDGGAFYGIMETPVGASIKRGVLIIDQESGSREVTETTHKFRYDARAKRFLLIGSDNRTRDRATGGGRFISTNYLTGRQEIEAFLGPDTPGQTQIKRVSRKLRTLESVRVEERYSG